jgi:predicted dehydrogenase
MLFGGDKKMVLYNDMEPTEKVKIYDSGFDVKSDEEINKIRVDYRIGDIYIPKLKTTEALADMARDFVRSVSKGTQPVSDWQTGLMVVKILQSADASIKAKGREVVLS